MPQRPPTSHRPRHRTTREWRRAAPAVGEDPKVYADRWRAFWEREALQAKDRLGSWDKVAPELLEALTRHVRLAEFHRSFAESDPYVGEGRTLRAHPGWALALAEERMAKDVLAQLGQRPQSRPEPEIPAEANGHSGLVDNLVGPDGQQL